MKDHLEDVQRLITQCRDYVAAARNFLQQPVGEKLAGVVSESETFLPIAEKARTDSFYLIVQRLKDLLTKSSSAGSVPSPLECEAIALAMDWLEQLSMLYADNLPEPKTLVNELLYALDLVERSQGAHSLRELLTSDPFAGDPGLDGKGYIPRREVDPFADDPGFGMAFDLLQRTLDRGAEQQVVSEDPFDEDTHYEADGDQKKSPTLDTEQALPYDVFDGDPPLSHN